MQIELMDMSPPLPTLVFLEDVYPHIYQICLYEKQTFLMTLNFQTFQDVPIHSVTK